MPSLSSGLHDDTRDGQVDMTLKQTVLIVEDEPVFRRVMSFTVARSGLQVETASDGDQAYQRLLQGGIDFLVTDHQMPVCTGLELLQRLVENNDVAQPPTILCTAKGLELDSRELESRFHLVGIMHKPFSPRKLSDLILAHLSGESPGPSIAAPSSTLPEVSNNVDAVTGAE